MSVEGSHTFKRPIYAGNAVVTVEAPQTARCRNGADRVVSLAAGGNSQRSKRRCCGEVPATRDLSDCSRASDRPDLQTAAKVVSGGRALAAQRTSTSSTTCRQTRRGVGARAQRSMPATCQRNAGWPDRQDHCARICMSRSAYPGRFST